MSGLAGLLSTFLRRPSATAANPPSQDSSVPPPPPPPPYAKNSRSHSAESEDMALRSVAKRRGQIFEQDVDGASADISSLIRDHRVMDPDTQTLLREAMSRFIGLGDHTNPETSFELVLMGMEREEFSRGAGLIRQGDLGSKLYVLEKGEVEITIDGKHIRTMGKGSVIGELALLYDAPRSATVTNMTNTVLWSLRREIFKQINAMSSAALYAQRSKWLHASPHLACLNAIELPRLVATLRMQVFGAGECLYSDREVTDRLMLIETGSAFVFTSTDMRGVSPGNVDKQLGIVRPKTKRTSVRSMSVTELGSYLSKTRVESLHDSDAEDVPTLRHDAASVLHAEGRAYYLAAEVYEGCVLGMGVLLGKARLPGGWTWVEQEEESERYSADGKGRGQKAQEDRSAPPSAHRSGAQPPYRVVAHTPTSGLVFTVPVFERLFGRAESVISAASAQTSPRKNTADSCEERLFDPASFEYKYVLGSGSFGTVVLAETREAGGLQHYALKIFNKCDIIETGQVKHVCDERRLLALMKSRFILKLYGTYQNTNQIVIVTECINNGDMWSVIYEPPFERVGLPRPLVQFYIASIVLALSHIHERGLAYRDLKPENIMVDSKGYIRIIDFGFCKAIPYTKTDAAGEVKVHAKSYTLCGTPEYLSPEFVFNLGHDFSADLWALGVTLYEMFMGVTPFAPRRADNVTDLFNKIANTKRKGVELSQRLDDKAGTPLAKLLCLKLLAPEPSDRLGVKEGYTGIILEDPFFADLDMEALKAGLLTPIYVPAPSAQRLALSLLVSKPFAGDQALFSSF